MKLIFYFLNKFNQKIKKIKSRRSSMGIVEKKKSEGKLPRIRVLKSIDRDDPFFKSLHFVNNKQGRVSLQKPSSHTMRLTNTIRTEKKMGLIEGSDDSESSDSEETDNEDIKKIDL